MTNRECAIAGMGKQDCFDIDMLIQAAKEYGAEIRQVKPGEGGIYVNGKKITADELFGCGLEDE